MIAAGAFVAVALAFSMRYFTKRGYSSLSNSQAVDIFRCKILIVETWLLKSEILEVDILTKYA